MLLNYLKHNYGSIECTKCGYRLLIVKNEPLEFMDWEMQNPFRK